MRDERICHTAVVIGPYCLWKLFTLPLNFSYAGHTYMLDTRNTIRSTAVTFYSCSFEKE
jgi:hypothetical protein